MERNGSTNEKERIMVNQIALGKRIRKARKTRAYTQEKLGELLGYSANHISHIERATTKMSIDCAVDLANVLEVSLDELFQDSIKFSTETKSEDDVWEHCSVVEKRFVIEVLQSYRNNFQAKMDIEIK